MLSSSRFVVAVHAMSVLARFRGKGPVCSALVAESVHTNPVVIRRLMTDRPMRYVVVTDDDRAMAATLIALPAVLGVSLRPRGGLEIEVSDFGAFAVALPRLARARGVRLLELTPTDESLESVFAYLVAS